MQARNPGRLIRAAIALTVLVGAAAQAHHSFSAYDTNVIKVLTGVVTRVNPDANHLQIFFAPMNEQRKNVLRDEKGAPIIWAVEMTGSAQAAREGIAVSSFPPGTIFSVALNPTRDGQNAGSRVRNSSIYRCPEKKPPAPGKHCDSVEGHSVFGTGGLPAPKE